MQLIVGAYSSWADYDDKDWSDLHGGVDEQVREERRGGGVDAQVREERRGGGVDAQVREKRRVKESGGERMRVDGR